eukprot:scaffold20946_cov64-Phaeocystis_antarctica.AAC.6
MSQCNRLYFEIAIQRRPKVTLSTCSGSNSSSAVVGTPCARTSLSSAASCARADMSLAAPTVCASVLAGGNGSTSSTT